LGGADQQNDLSMLASHVVERAKGAAMFGAVAGELEELLRRADKTFPCFRRETLPEAFAWCWEQSQPGDAILLSPGCASTDQFRDFAQRGEMFEGLVGEFSSRERQAKS
jgi:UDP-N-acetylmuramoylalanine--D-glutamate ligase